jgi:hypothetical protein
MRFYRKIFYLDVAIAVAGAHLVRDFLFMLLNNWKILPLPRRNHLPQMYIALRI